MTNLRNTAGRLGSGVLGMLFAGAVLAGVAWSQALPKLVAPVYGGATNLGCESESTFDKCVFATKDAPDQVKAFYEKSSGPLSAIKNGYIAPLRAGKAVEGEGTTSTVFATVTIRSKPAVTLPPANDQNTVPAVLKLKYLNVLYSQVGWSTMGHPIPAQDLKQTGLRSPDEFYAVFQKYKHLESAYYPKDQAEAARARYDSKMAELTQKYQQAGQQIGRDNASAFDQLRKDQANQRQSMADSCKQGPTPQQKADYEQLAGIIKKNSADRYRRFTAARDQMEKDGCPPADQPFDLNSPRMQHAMEMGKIIQEDKEAAAFAEKMGKRDDANRPKSAGAEALTRNSQASQKLTPDHMNASWQAGLDYLAAMDKIYLRTRISIDGEKFGADGGGIVTDRAKVNALWAKTNADDREKIVGDDDKSGGATGSTGQKPAAAQPAPGKKTPSADDATEAAKKAGKEGLNALKKFF